MNIIDSHCHLYLPEFQNDLDQVIIRAREVGVQKFFLPNIDSSTLKPLLKVVSDYPEECYAMMGLHPTSVKENYKEELEIVERELTKGKYVAIGEIGIDLYWDKTYLKEQVDVFERQIIWAKEHNLPVVIHARDSFQEIFEVLNRLNDDSLTGIFHCFTGSIEDAKKIMNYGGFKLGIGGVVTFKNGGIDKFLNEIPLNNLVLETDSPYLAPVPYRGKRNESAYLTEILLKIADIYNLDKDEIAETTSLSSLEIFNIK